MSILLRNKMTRYFNRNGCKAEFDDGIQNAVIQRRLDFLGGGWIETDKNGIPLEFIDNLK